MALPLRAPLRSVWFSATALRCASPGGERIYGVTPDGRVAALNAASGDPAWLSGPGYLPRMSATGSLVYVLKRGTGLAVLTDAGSSFTEHLGLAIQPCDESTPLSRPVIDDGLVYLAVRQELFALGPDGQSLFAAPLSGSPPYGVTLWKRRKVAVTDGFGQVEVCMAGPTGFVRLWRAGPGASGGGAPTPALRPCLPAGDRLYTAGSSAVVALDAAGRTLWSADAPEVRALAAGETAVYAARAGLIWALRPESGVQRWVRCWAYPPAVPPETALYAAGEHLFAGHLSSDAARGDLIALSSADGSLLWQSPGDERNAAGLPLPVPGNAPGPGLLLASGSAAGTGLFGPLPLQPMVTPGDLTADPQVLRGEAGSFAPLSVRLRLKAAAGVRIFPWRAWDGPAAPILQASELGPGTHAMSWDPRPPGGFTDAPQIGRLVAEISEPQFGLAYATVLPLPVGTLPDIVHHWARGAIEAMLYHRFAGGYPDLTFRPDNQITRAESASIIARTLGLTGPGPGFRSRLTDIRGHWAETAILALEEQGVIAGFREPDGTFTFRPEGQMTRAQEARILTLAYAVPPAPPAFASRFTDMRGHWAEPDVRALEAGGFVTGFREPDGTYTYRPERNLTRAELCAMVVRIRGLTRS